MYFSHFNKRKKEFSFSKGRKKENLLKTLSDLYFKLIAFGCQQNNKKLLFYFFFSLVRLASALDNELVTNR